MTARLPTDWIAPLARPYLRDFRPLAASGALEGFWFVRTAPLPAARRASHLPAAPRQNAVGFFVGFLTEAAGYEFLAPLAPECVVLAFVHPVGGSLHKKLVQQPDALLHKTFGYIRWLTHRPPRFEFHESQLPTLVRHTSMRPWPRAKVEHFSRNFFIETLAWLVRSGLVARLRNEPLEAQRGAAKKKLSRKPSRRPRSRPAR